MIWWLGVLCAVGPCLAHPKAGSIGLWVLLWITPLTNNCGMLCVTEKCVISIDTSIACSIPGTSTTYQYSVEVEGRTDKSSEIITTALTRVRAVLNNAYHRDQRSQGYHLQVVLFRSDSVLIISDEMSKSNFARIMTLDPSLL